MKQTKTSVAAPRSRRAFTRLLACWAVCLGSMVFWRAAGAQELARGEKPLPDANDVFALAGQPVASMFAKFGAPSNVSPWDESGKSEKVEVAYGPFSFVLRDKKVLQCVLWDDWKGPVMGVKIGDSADEIKKVLGNPHEDIKNANGTGMMVWIIKDHQLEITLNKEHKSDGAFFGPKE